MRIVTKSSVLSIGGWPSSAITEKRCRGPFRTLGFEWWIPLHVSAPLFSVSNESNTRHCHSLQTTDSFDHYLVKVMGC